MGYGKCWAFSGGYGRVVIKLSHDIIPTSFSIEHVPFDVANQCVLKLLLC